MTPRTASPIWLPYVEARLAAIAAGTVETFAGWPVDTATLDKFTPELRRLVPGDAPTPSIIPGDMPGEIAADWRYGRWNITITVAAAATHVWARNRDEGEPDAATFEGTPDDVMVEWLAAAFYSMP